MPPRFRLLDPPSCETHSPAIQSYHDSRGRTARCILAFAVMSAQGGEGGTDRKIHTDASQENELTTRGEPATDVSVTNAAFDGAGTAVPSRAAESAQSSLDDIQRASPAPSAAVAAAAATAANANLPEPVASTASRIYSAPQQQTPMSQEGISDAGRTASDLDVVLREAGAEAPTLADGVTGGAGNELQRLRELVLKSRGAKGQLPPGWDDTEDVAEGSVSDRKQTDAMLERAIARFGAELEDSGSNDESSSSSDEASNTDSDSDADSSSSSGSSSSAASTSRIKATSYGRGRDRHTPALVGNGDDEDDEDDQAGTGGLGPTTKNEVIAPTVDAPPFTIVPDELEIRPLGRIHSIVDCVVVVSQDTGRAPGGAGPSAATGTTTPGSAFPVAMPPPIDRTGRTGEQEGEYSVLDTGSLLSLEDRNVLGVVYETFGSVLAPLYALRYPSAQDVNRQQIVLGKAVWYVPSQSSYVLTRALRAMGKGSDASNIWDEEVAAEEQEFSDDEQEAAFKRSLKANKGKGGKKRGRADSNSKCGDLGAAAAAANSFGASGASRLPAPMRHALPARPTAPPSAPAHRDADVGSMSLDTRAPPLPYDDDGGAVNSSTIAEIGASSYANDLPAALPLAAMGPSNAYADMHRQSTPRPNRGRGRGRGHGVGAGAGPRTANPLPSSPAATVHAMAPAQGQSPASGGAYNPSFFGAAAPWSAPSHSQYPQQPQLQHLQQQQPQRSPYAGGYGAHNASSWNVGGGHNAYSPINGYGYSPSAAPIVGNGNDAGTRFAPPQLAGASAYTPVNAKTSHAPQQQQHQSAPYDPSQPHLPYATGWAQQPHP